MMARNFRAGVLGVAHAVADQPSHVLVLKPVKHLRPSRRVRTNLAIRSLARCWDTDGAGLPTRSASSLIQNSPRCACRR
jgi:hypothetical protein